MLKNSKPKISVVIPNWNGIDSIGTCLDSLLAQTLPPHIIVVENGSIDGSLEFIREKYPSVELVVHDKNLGFAGGVNGGIRRAIERNDDFVALFNNDAVADKNWLRELFVALEQDKRIGAATCKLMGIDGKRLDSTGDIYSIWGLPFPRGRGEPVTDKYDKLRDIFGASGGASIYRVSMLKEIGLFDEDFFAYYEDIDISFRAQLYGWRINYAPTALAYHQISATSSKIKDFTTYQTIKNLPFILWKNVPSSLLWKVWPRFTLAYILFCGRALQRRQFSAVTRGLLRTLLLLPKKITERRLIQQERVVTVGYVWQMMQHDLPPNAHNLRALRTKWWRLTRKEVK